MLASLRSDPRMQFLPLLFKIQIVFEMKGSLFQAVSKVEIKEAGSFSYHCFGRAKKTLTLFSLQFQLSMEVCTVFAPRTNYILVAALYGCCRRRCEFLNFQSKVRLPFFLHSILKEELVFFLPLLSTALETT